MQRIKGIAVSHGIIVGRAFLVGTAEQVVPHRIIAESEVPAPRGTTLMLKRCTIFRAAETSAVDRGKATASGTWA